MGGRDSLCERQCRGGVGDESDLEVIEEWTGNRACGRTHDSSFTIAISNLAFPPAKSIARLCAVGNLRRLLHWGKSSGSAIARMDSEERIHGENGVDDV